MQYMLPLILIGSHAESINVHLKSIQDDQKISDSYVFTYTPEVSVLIDDVRDISRYVRDLDAGKKHLVVLHKFHTAKPDSQNAFLKTLEEYGHYVQFVLIAEEETALLPTIRSRTLIHYLEATDTSTEILREYGFDKLGITYAQWLSASSQVPKEKLHEVLRALIFQLREKYQNPKTPKLMRELMLIYSHVRKNSVNPEYALDAVGKDWTS